MCYSRTKIDKITALIKEYEWTITKKSKKHGKKVFLAKTKLNTIEIITSKSLIESGLSQEKLVSVNYVRSKK